MCQIFLQISRNTVPYVRFELVFYNGEYDEQQRKKGGNKGVHYQSGERCLGRHITGLHLIVSSQVSANNMSI